MSIFNFDPFQHAKDSRKKRKKKPTIKRVKRVVPKRQSPPNKTRFV